jgi:hypothetical protein
MTVSMRNVSSPEIMRKNIKQWRIRNHVQVRHNRTAIIEYKITPTAVEVGHSRRNEYQNSIPLHLRRKMSIPAYHNPARTQTVEVTLEQQRWPRCTWSHPLHSARAPDT